MREQDTQQYPTTAPHVRLVDIFRRFWPDVRPFCGWLAVSLLLVPVAAVLDAGDLWLFKILVDDVLTPHNYGLFPALAAAFVGITVAAGLVSFADGYLSTWVAEKFLLNLRGRVFRHLQRLSLSFFERRPLGDTISRLTSDIAAIERLVVAGVARFVSYSFRIALYAGLLFYLSWRLAAVSLLAAPIFLLLAKYFSLRIRNVAREARRRSGTISAVAEESLGNLMLTQAYNQEDAEADRFQRENLGSFQAEVRASRLSGLFSGVIDLLETVGVLIVVGVGVGELADGRITLGGLLVFLAYLAQLYRPVRGFGRLSNTAASASASAERVIDLLDQQPDVRTPARPVPLPQAEGVLSFDNVSFTYPGSRHPALSGLTFTVRPGQTVAIVGASGAGKSTLGKLLLRFYDPDRGSISLDGHDLRTLDLVDLRRNIAVVMQETLVLDGSIRDNIRWGRPDADEAGVVRAAMAADAHGFVTQRPDGYDTRVGQRGRQLSGGQRQRVAIARAMIRDAPVLLLDEPATGLDAASKQRVLEPLRRLMRGRTTLVISHDLLTTANADLILFLTQGRVSEAGSHRELMARDGDYARLYRLHQHEPIPVAAPQEPAWTR
ncbi:MAG TPA: ABC transporter ATP-binding protein [Micromonosporaceae bacterium]